jgi:hypothetical protein
MSLFLKALGQEVFQEARLGAANVNLAMDFCWFVRRPGPAQAPAESYWASGLKARAKYISDLITGV